jgi:RNA polymerase sigma-70 factor (ECF subfamily)
MTDSLKSELSGSTSASLLQRARERNTDAWEKLTAVYSPLVYQWCRQAGLQSHDAADVVQEVFSAVNSGLDRFRRQQPQDSFRGWLWTITRNKIRDYFRARAKQAAAAGGTTANLRFQSLPDEIPGEPDDRSSQQWQSKLARRAVALMQTDFAESTWRAFWLTAVEHQPAASVAEQLEMSVAAVYMAKSRVLRHLRREFAGLDLAD